MEPIVRNVAVVLSGCGHKDGSEITESVSILIALGQNYATYKCFAPNIQFDSATYTPFGSSQSRNTIEESSRISRTEVADLKTLNESDFDAIVFPGGFGAAKHLSNWADLGPAAKVHPEVSRVIMEFYKASKPIGAACIAPTLVAKVLGKQHVTVTLGDDIANAKLIEKTGAYHENCSVQDYVTDREMKVVTTPAYMYDNALPSEVFRGISAMIKELVEMA